MIRNNNSENLETVIISSAEHKTSFSKQRIKKHISEIGESIFKAASIVGGLSAICWITYKGVYITNQLLDKYVGRGTPPAKYSTDMWGNDPLYVVAEVPAALVSLAIGTIIGVAIMHLPEIIEDIRFSSSYKHKKYNSEKQ